MSCTRHVETFQNVEVKIEFNEDCIKNVEQTSELILNQKLAKMNILFKTLNVYCHNNILLVNDKHNICKDFKEIANSFGFNVINVDCTLKGTNYILNDDLLEILMTINPSFSIDNISNKSLTSDIESIIDNYKIILKNSDNKIKIIRELKEKGYLITKGSQKTTTTYEDGYIVSETKSEIVSNASSIRKDVQDFINKSSNILKKGNSQLRDGTAKLLYSRAKQMGYAVKEEKKGNQIQLVLMRYE